MLVACANWMDFRLIDFSVEWDSAISFRETLQLLYSLVFLVILSLFDFENLCVRLITEMKPFFFSLYELFIYLSSSIFLPFFLLMAEGYLCVYLFQYDTWIESCLCICRM